MFLAKYPHNLSKTPRRFSVYINKIHKKELYIQNKCYLCTLYNM